MSKKLLFNFNREVIQNYTYVKYAGTIITATNTLEKPIKSAILKGSTKYRDIDTGEFLETFEDGRNLELVSVKMPVLSTVGKNLFNFKTEEVFHGWLHNGANFIPDVGSNCMTTDYIQIKENVRYSHNGISMGFYDHNKKAIGGRIDNQTIVSPSNAKYMRVTFVFDAVPVDKFQYVIGEWSGYEPYKSNILTVNEDVTLRGIDEVKDELNCSTGEVTVRIKEVVLNGSENWTTRNGGTSYAYFINNFFDYNNVEGITNSFKFIKGGSLSTQTQESICSATTQTALSLFTNKYELSTVQKLKTYLSQNPVTIQYILEEESIKTVDLSILDQNENKVSSISSFNDTTHITASSETIPPIFEGYLATKEVE